MVTFVRSEDGATTTKVSSRTPRIPGVNRRTRRNMIYGHRVARLFNKVLGLRLEMSKAGIKIPKLPKGHNRNVLSGHMGVLKTLALKETMA